MPRSGTGTYSLVAGLPFVTGTVISSSVMNNQMNDIATALTASIANDGQTPITADLPMTGKKSTSATFIQTFIKTSMRGRTQGKQMAMALVISFSIKVREDTVATGAAHPSLCLPQTTGKHRWVRWKVSRKRPLCVTL